MRSWENFEQRESTVRDKINVDYKTAPSFARSPKIGVFERVLTRGREMGERSEEGVARISSSPRSPISRLRVKNRSKTPIFGLLAKEEAVLQSKIDAALKRVI